MQLGKSIKIYHASLSCVEHINLNLGHEYKDFGKGFYTTTSKEQAERFAGTIKRRSGSKRCIINKYTFEIVKNISIIEFKFPSIEWLDFICFCRTHSGVPHKYDIVAGPVADDNTFAVIQSYMKGLYGDVSLKRTKEFVIKLLMPMNLKNQIYFGSNNALKCISYMGYYTV